MIGTTPIPSVLRPTLRQSAQSGRVGSFQQHHCTLMVGRKPGDHSVGLFGIMRPLHHRRVGGNRLAALRHGLGKRVQRLVGMLPTVTSASAPPSTAYLPTSSCRRCSSGPSSSMAPRTAILNGCCSAPACQRDRPSSPAFMESGLALNESSISVNDVSGLVTVDTAMRCGLMLGHVG